jgi:hypothetical protein
LTFGRFIGHWCEKNYVHHVSFFLSFFQQLYRTHSTTPGSVSSSTSGNGGGNGNGGNQQQNAAAAASASAVAASQLVMLQQYQQQQQMMAQQQLAGKLLHPNYANVCTLCARFDKNFFQ